MGNGTNINVGDIHVERDGTLVIGVGNTMTIVRDFVR